jgi:hypothetical protein
LSDLLPYYVFGALIWKVHAMKYLAFSLAVLGAGVAVEGVSYNASFVTSSDHKYTLDTGDTVTFNTLNTGNPLASVSHLAILLCQTKADISTLSESNSWAVGYVSQGK